MSDLKYWLGFNLVKGIGPAKLEALLAYFGDIGTAWQANEYQLKKIGLDGRSIQSFLDTRAEIDLDRQLAQVQSAGVSLLTWDTPDYPSYTAHLKYCPIIPIKRVG
jgi:DNA processing protein